MSRQLNVNLQMTADTSQAKKQLQDLQNQLSNLASTKATGTGFGYMASDIQKATVQIGILKKQLKEATDVNTGKLDLSKFNQQLKTSGTTLKNYQKTLSSLGVEGERAFAQLAVSVANADAKIQNTHSVVKKFGESLARTATWQLSSSVLHGFMGSIQTAIGYAEDLNKSLTKIQIVSNQSAEQMAAFAKEANKSAQALSTTTTAYTDAALIFYQQGNHNLLVGCRI